MTAPDLTSIEASRDRIRTAHAAPRKQRPASTARACTTPR